MMSRLFAEAYLEQPKRLLAVQFGSRYAFACSKLTIERLGQRVKYVQS